MRSIRVAIAAVLACVVSACSDSASSTAPTSLDATTSPALALSGGTGATTRLTSRFASDMCLDVPAGQFTNGRVLETWSCHGGANQQFIWKSTGEIVAAASQGMCVDALSGNGAAGDQIGLWACHGGPNQKWSASANGEIKGINSRCIGLTTAARANGTRVTLQNCSTSSTQQWDNGAGGSPVAPPPAAPPAAPAPPPSDVPAGAIAIYPGQSIQAAVNANPNGAAFLIKTGTHTRQSVIPKSGNTFVGESGAVLDGQGVGYAFNKGGGPANNVTIRGLKITNYSPGMQSATVDAGGYFPNEGSTGWVIQNNEVSYNGEYGIRIGNSSRILNNNVHHNKRLNIAGSANDAVIEGNEVAYGNYLSAYNTNFEAGGTKFAYTERLTLRNNYVHDNVGVGLHMDENNINTLIEDNRIASNASEGIAIEISYATIIRNNTITNNGFADPRNRYSYVWNAGIGIHASPNVEVYGNTLSGNYAGIVAIQQNRDVDKALYGRHLVQNLNVHDNTITQTNLPRNGNELSVAAGIVQDFGDNGIFSGWNNRFTNNRYYLGGNPRPFAWNNGTRTESEWRGFGQDLSGLFSR